MTEAKKNIVTSSVAPSQNSPASPYQPESVESNSPLAPSTSVSTPSTSDLLKQQAKQRSQETLKQKTTDQFYNNPLFVPTKPDGSVNPNWERNRQIFLERTGQVQKEVEPEQNLYNTPIIPGLKGTSTEDIVNLGGNLIRKTSEGFYSGIDKLKKGVSTTADAFQSTGNPAADLENITTGILESATGVTESGFSIASVAVPELLAFTATSEGIKDVANKNLPEYEANYVNNVVDFPFAATTKIAEAAGFDPTKHENVAMALQLADLAAVVLGGHAYKKATAGGISLPNPIQSLKDLQELSKKAAENKLTPEEKLVYDKIEESIPEVTPEAIKAEAEKRDTPEAKTVSGEISKLEPAAEKLSPELESINKQLEDLSKENQTETILKAQDDLMAQRDALIENENAAHIDRGVNETHLNELNERLSEKQKEQEAASTETGKASYDAEINAVKQEIKNLTPENKNETLYTGRGEKYDDLSKAKGDFIFFSKNPKVAEYYGGEKANVSEHKLDTSDFLDLTSQENKAKFIRENFTDEDIHSLFPEIKREAFDSRDVRKTYEQREQDLISKYREKLEEDRFSGDGKRQQFLLNKIKEKGYKGVNLLDTFFGENDISHVVIDKNILKPKDNSVSPPLKEEASSGQKEYGSTAEEKAINEGLKFETEPEFDNYIAENSDNVFELAETYIRSANKAENVKDYIESHLDDTGFKITKSDFSHYGDPNNVNFTTAKRYFSKDAAPLDTQLSEMSDALGIEITPQDVIDIISKQEQNRVTPSAIPLKTKLKSRYAELTNGRDLSPSEANRVLTTEAKKVSKDYGKYIEQEHFDANAAEQSYYDQLKRGEETAIEGGETPSVSESSQANQKGEGSTTGVTHAQIDKIANEFGVDEYEKNPETQKQWEEEANKIIESNPRAIPELIKKLENGGEATPVDQKIMQRYMSSLNARLRDNMSDELIAEFKKAKDVSDIQMGRDVAKSLVARKGEIAVEDTLGGMLAEMQEASGVDALTDIQKEAVKKSFEEIEASKIAAEEKIKKLEDELAKYKANKNFKNTVDESYRNRRKVTKEKLDTEFEDLHKAFQKATRTTLNANINPEAVIIIGKMARNRVEKGVVNLQEVIDNIYDKVKEANISKEDIRDVIAGKYKEKKQTINELTSQIRDLRDEAKYINKLEALQRGEAPKTEIKRIARNKEITELQQKIKDFKKESGISTETALRSAKTRNENSLKKLEEKIQNKDYETKKRVSPLDSELAKTKFPELRNEVLDAIKKKEDANHQWYIDKAKAEIALHNRFQKAYEGSKKIVTTLRAIKAGIDDSFTMIQGGLAMMANPQSGAKAFKEHVLDAASEKRFERELTALHNSENWDLIKNSKLDILEPKSIKEREREGVLDYNLLNENFKIKGKEFNVGKYTTRPFERAFISMGNNLRLNIFMRRAEQLQKEGKTFESHPQEYKDLAEVVNTMTGRGTLHPLADNKLVNSVIWSPRLLASGLNILGYGDIANPITRGKKGYYAKLTPEMRKYAVSQTVKGVGLGVGLMLAAKAGGADVDLDPTSVTFGNVRFNRGGNSYNVFGRFVPIARLTATSATGKKTYTDGKIKKTDAGKETLRFLRGKLTPLMGTAVDIATGKTYMGEDVTVSSELHNMIDPLSLADIIKGVKEDGSASILDRAIPAFEGIKVTNENDFKKDK